MSKRVAGQALRVAAFAGVALGSALLAGCSTLGFGGGGDVTGATGDYIGSAGPQAMPQPLKPIGRDTRVAEGPYTPPEDINGGGSGTLVTGSLLPPGNIQSSALPPLQGSNIMPAQQNLAPAAPKTASLGTLPTNNSTPTLVVSNGGHDTYAHTIESGESLYTIARRYDVTAQAIMQANGISAPDKIFVGQKIVIPGRADLLAKKDTAVTKVAAIAPMDPPKAAPHVTALADPEKPLVAPKTIAPVVQKQPAAPVVAPPQQVAAINPAPPKAAPPVEQQMSGADKFRWPVSGKVTTDFISSKGTGINIDAPEGTAVRAAENGQVIYVGSGVEGYGNLVLIRHPNGYVSAYAHLKATSVNKGDNVSRGDNIGSVGMTGSVSRPQLHFELRKGATPVDPVPLLAG
jgi:murein DD-endopeptidase MepM/ murein hydrolase activator NlpD